TVAQGVLAARVDAPRGSTMTSKRKAEIQRKLTLAAVPRPPEDLADRIKADIPKYLNIEAERARFSRSVGFNLRIAASIIVLLSSLAAVLFLIIPDDAPMTMTTLSAPRAKQSMPAPAVPKPAPVPTEEVHVDIVQQAAASNANEPVRLAKASTPASPRIARDERSRSRADDDSEVQGVAGGVEGGVVGGGVISGVASERQRVVVTAEAPAIDFAPQPPAEAPPAPTAMAPRPETSA